MIKLKNKKYQEKQKHEAGKHLVIAKLLSLGHSVFNNVVNSIDGIDLVVKVSKRFIPIQIRTSSKPSTNGSYSFWGSKHTTKSKFIICVVKGKDFYIIPKQKVTCSHIQIYTKDWGHSKYMKYRNNWDLLKRGRVR